MAARQRVKYYVLNKEMDYRRGFLENMDCDGQGLHTRSGDGILCVFISRLFDGQEPGTRWHRMQLKTWGAKTASPWRLCFFSSDDPFILKGRTAVPVEEIIARSDAEMSIEEKKEAFIPFLQLEVMNTEDLLLHQVRGRYLWFMLEVYAAQEEIGFGNMMIYFQKQSWIKYLPEIYDRSDQDDTFLERYLAIFQSLYDDLDREINEIPVKLDARAAEGPVLEWLASWLGIQNIGVWSEKQLRYLVNHGPQFYQRRGTPEGIRNFIHLYTGEMPFIAEQHKMECIADNERLYILLRNLYGTNPYVFTILVRESCLPTGKEFSDLTKIIEDTKPAWMDFRIITLRPYILLDSYSYLGVNSVLGRYMPVELDGTSMVSFSTVGDMWLNN